MGVYSGLHRRVFWLRSLWRLAYPTPTGRPQLGCAVNLHGIVVVKWNGSLWLDIKWDFLILTIHMDGR